MPLPVSQTPLYIPISNVNHEAKIHYNRLPFNYNPIILNLVVPFTPGNPPKRLERKLCRDLRSPPILNLRYHPNLTCRGHQKQKKNK